ncbi:MAG TPA: hypothetical protein PLY87_25570 [Planctomycetaceae bacterium]|jgi:hypothetical protein|nr:hypothetical protein [Sulfuritalea sp.]HQZ68494.1 hypothetical protein [Planctomycetaceae bacterium]
MPRPSDVNPHNFHVVEVLYDLNGFSVAWGQSEDGNKLLGMRWNGDGPDDPGYPKTFGNPVWFHVPDELSVPLAKQIEQLHRNLAANPPVSTSTN